MELDTGSSIGHLYMQGQVCSPARVAIPRGIQRSHGIQLEPAGRCGLQLQPLSIGMHDRVVLNLLVGTWPRENWMPTTRILNLDCRTCGISVPNPFVPQSNLKGVHWHGLRSVTAVQNYNILSRPDQCNRDGSLCCEDRENIPIASLLNPDGNGKSTSS